MLLTSTVLPNITNPQLGPEESTSLIHESRKQEHVAMPAFDLKVPPPVLSEDAAEPQHGCDLGRESKKHEAQRLGAYDT